jgi:hypothetical protein
MVNDHIADGGKKVRLIDANAIKALFDERYDDAFMQYHTRAGKSLWWGLCGGINWGRNTIADAPTVDAVPVADIEAWLYEIAMNNTGNPLCGACEEIIRRLDGLRRFSKERSTDA